MRNDELANATQTTHKRNQDEKHKKTGAALRGSGLEKTEENMPDL